MKYDFVEVNNFIVANGSAEHYEADLKLYRKLFPDSGILKDLENPFSPKKKELDERMLFEILNADRICMETIMENRGIIITQDTAKTIKMPPLVDDAFMQTVLGQGIDTLKYNELKTYAFALKLNVPDQKADTLRAALTAYGASIAPSPLLPITPSQDDAPIVDELPEGEKKS